TLQQLVDSCARRTAMYIALQPDDDARKHLHVGMGEVSVRARAAVVRGQGAQPVSSCPRMQRTGQRQSVEHGERLGQWQSEACARLLRPAVYPAVRRDLDDLRCGRLRILPDRFQIEDDVAALPQRAAPHSRTVRSDLAVTPLGTVVIEAVPLFAQPPATISPQGEPLWVGLEDRRALPGRELTPNALGDLPAQRLDCQSVRC